MSVDSAGSSLRTDLGFSKKILSSGVDVLMKTMSLVHFVEGIIRAR